MACSRLCRTLLLAVAVPGSALVLLAGCGGATGGSAGDLGAADLPLIDWGRYHFGVASANLTNPYFTANSDTPDLTFAGYGDQAGKQMVMGFVYGNRVAGIKSLKVTRTITGAAEHSDWFGQDSRGNVHYVKTKIGDAAPQDRGVIASGGVNAYFSLPRAQSIQVGLRWYDWLYQAFKVEECRVMSMTASLQGTNNLLLVRDIRDGNEDRTFDPRWQGPDHRTDLYYNPATHMLHAVQTTAAGGFARSGS